MITRTFHPVGQGAFYTEEHNCPSVSGNNYFIVYDCGNWKNEHFAQNLIKNVAKKQRDIDILFISHFDYDHVSGISILLEYCNIKMVVLPLLHRFEKILLSRFYKVLGYDDVELLLSDPESYFGGDTLIAFVEPTDDEDEDQEEYIKTSEGEKIDQGVEIIDYHAIKKYIPARSAIKLEKCSWVYVPYNKKYSTINSKLLKEIQKEGLNIDELINDPSYANTNVKILRKIYRKLDGNINENSMLVYSGPFLKKHSHLRHFHTYTYPIFYNMIGRKLERVGCLYTGDANLNKINSRAIYRPYWANIGTIQIPHHGDRKSLESSILMDNHYVCPYSYGKNNSYGHPSPLLPSILASALSHYIEVTEEPRKIYKETIKC